jgi:hypothetical protein
VYVEYGGFNGSQATLDYYVADYEGIHPFLGPLARIYLWNLVLTINSQLIDNDF